MFRCCRRAGAAHAQVCGWPRSAGRQLLSRLGRHAALSSLAHSPLQCQSSSSPSGAGRTTSSRASSASSQYTAALQAGRQIDALHNISTTPFLAACRCEYTKATQPQIHAAVPAQRHAAHLRPGGSTRAKRAASNDSRSGSVVPYCFISMCSPVWFSIMYLGFSVTSLVCLQGLGGRRQGRRGTGGRVQWLWTKHARQGAPSACL